MWRNYVFKKKKQICESEPVQYLSNSVRESEPMRYLEERSEKISSGGPKRGYVVDKIKKGLSKLPNAATELFAFNAFQIPFYSGILSAATWISEGEMNWEKVQKGAENVFIYSPILAPFLGWYLDKFRKLFKIKSAPDQAQENN